MFSNAKLNYAKIIIGKMTIEGPCTYWEMGYNGAYIKLIINDKEYIVGISNVLLTEDPNQK